MKKILLVCILVVSTLTSNSVLKADWAIDVVVAKDGSGDFTSVQAAINSAPAGNTENFVVFIKKGVYDEKIFIENNFITLLGEERDSTIITQAILRRLYVEQYSTDWGVATINIADTVKDFTLANLTVRNNYADVYPETANNHDHTMAIRGGGHRVIIVNCNITATGGDTLSLWNTNGGMYYHSGCFFNGYVDYVCPRGYCYITNSDFYGYNNNASIWHDGAGGKDHKLVVKNSYFDGVKDFGLGRFHRVSAFYMLDCDFSPNVRNNGGILYVGDSATNIRDTLGLAIRVYYDRCDRETGDYEWHQNNLNTAENSPSREGINASWTFMNLWNPETEIKGLLPCAFLPTPGYRAKKVDVNQNISWLSGKDAVKHLVYFGTNENPDFITETTDTTYEPGILEGTSIYYWRIDEVTSENDTVKGQLWRFSTQVDSLPKQAFNPFPGNDSIYLKYTIAFTWEANSLDVDSFYFYFGAEDNLPLLSSQIEAGYKLMGLDGDTTYYWRVDTKNDFGMTQGEVWKFHYKPDTPSLINNLQTDINAIVIYPNPANDIFKVDYFLEKECFFSLKLTDLQGKLLALLKNEYQTPGKYSYPIDIRNNSIKLQPGLYILKFEFGNKIYSKRLLVK